MDGRRHRLDYAIGTCLILVGADPNIIALIESLTSQVSVGSTIHAVFSTEQTIIPVCP